MKMRTEGLFAAAVFVAGPSIVSSPEEPVLVVVVVVGLIVGHNKRWGLEEFIIFHFSSSRKIRSLGIEILYSTVSIQFAESAFGPVVTAKTH